MSVFEIETILGGRMVKLCDLPRELISVNDIARVLSRINRYNGRCKILYPVAQHSVIVANFVYKITGDARLALEALFHDATEAFTGDIISPIKYASETVQLIESLVWDSIHRAMPDIMPTWDDRSEIVIGADEYVKAAEMDILMGPCKGIWEVEIQDLSDAKPRCDIVAARMFLEKYEELSAMIAA